MTERLRFAPPRQAPAGLWRRTPPMIFAPLLALLALALAWRVGIDRFSLPQGLSGFLDGVAAALFVFAALAYLVKLLRRPSVLAEEQTTLPGRVGTDAGAAGLCLLGGVLSPHMPLAGQGALILGLVALLVLILLDLRALSRARMAGGAGAAEVAGPERQLRWAGLLAAAAVAPMMGWPGLGQMLIWPGALGALVVAVLSLRQLRRRRIPPVLLPLMALHLAAVAAYGAAAVNLGAALQQPAFGLTLAGLLLVPWFAIRAGTGLFLAALTVPVSLAAWFLSILAAANPGLWGLGILAGLVLVAATLICVPATFIVMRDWARGRLAVRSNAAIA